MAARFKDKRENATMRRGGIVVRKDDMGIDEVVADNCTVHLERMDNNDFALIVYAKGQTSCYRIAAKRATVTTFECWADLGVTRQVIRQKAIQ